MPVINAPIHHSAFHNGKQIAAIYQGTTKVWPAVISNTASTVIAGNGVIVPHFDVVLTKGVVETFNPKWRVPQNTSDAPYSAGLPPYGYPLLFLTFRVEKIEGATGPVGLKIGAVPWPGTPAAPPVDTCVFFAYAFHNLVAGGFYSQSVTSTSDWNDFKPSDANLVFCGELTNATKVYLSNVTMMLHWS